MIQKFMTAFPHSIRRDQPITVAVDMMREYRIRHLPVQDGGKLLGVLTDRDVKLAASFKGADKLIVEDVMTPDAFTVPPEAPADKVAAEMAAHKYGCAIVQQANGKVVGIFTAVDGMRVLGEMLEAHYKH
ncbi:MAG: CBS domain-containing protein [Oligoflexia bacterium]